MIRALTSALKQRPKLGAGGLTGLQREHRAQALRIMWVHALTALTYITGLAISTVPFSDHSTRSVATSPLVPVLHLVCALLLLIAATTGRCRGLATITSLAVLVGYAVMLVLAARLRVPPLGLAAVPFVFGACLNAFRLSKHWGFDDDDDTKD